MIDFVLNREKTMNRMNYYFWYRYFAFARRGARSAF